MRCIDGVRGRESLKLDEPEHLPNVAPLRFHVEFIGHQSCLSSPLIHFAFRCGLSCFASFAIALR
jgi:hypothetical protein